jgi:hypothetical protein
MKYTKRGLNDSLYHGHGYVVALDPLGLGGVGVLSHFCTAISIFLSHHILEASL